MRSLAMRFNGILRGREADPLPEWIDNAIETDLALIVRFARTLNQDFDAVKKPSRCLGATAKQKVRSIA